MSAEPKPKISKLDDHDSALVLCHVEQTRKDPGKPTRDSLDAEWSEGILQAQQSGPAGTTQWLKVIHSRSPQRSEQISRAIDVARTEVANREPIAGQVEGQQWDDPILASATSAVPFPVDVFPPQLAALVTSHAAVLSSPTDYLGIAALATASVAIGRSVALSMRNDWSECASLYCVLVGKSGQSKSPSISKMIRPLRKLAKVALDIHIADKDREADKPKDQQQPIAPLRRTIVDDATIESLGPILQDNPRGVGMIRDELTALTGGMNQYKSGKGNDREFYLSSWSGSPWSIDRKNNPDGIPIFVPNPFLTIVGNMVNSKLAALSDAKDQGDGFIERLLFAIPEPTPIRWSDEDVDEDLMETWSGAIERLWNVSMMDSEEGPRPFYVRLDSAAMSVFKAWHDPHFEETESLDFPSSLAGVWAKLKAYVVRFALILDRLDCVYDPTDSGQLRSVTGRSMSDAIRLVDYFKVQARRANDLMRGTAGGDSEDGRAILKWIFNAERRSFNDRAVKLNFDARFQKNGPGYEAAIAWLIERRCIRILPAPTASPKGGRPASRAYEVHPALLNPKLSGSSPADPG